jgi:hypothetical protein
MVGLMVFEEKDLEKWLGPRSDTGDGRYGKTFY